MDNKRLCIAVTALLAFSVVSTPAWAGEYMPDQGMQLTVVSQAESDIVSITGSSIKPTDVIFSIWSPSHNLVKLDQVVPDEKGNFATELNISALQENGWYTIVANQGNAELYELEARVMIVDGMASDAIAVDSNFERSSMVVGPALFEGGELTLVADAMEGDDTIDISGQTDITNMPITLTVIAPNGNVVSADQIDADADGLFAATISIGGPLWSQDGDYTVMAQQDMAGYETSMTVGVADGLVIPEFGTIAALVLAASIVSIVAVSAKSRLSLVPRF